MRVYPVDQGTDAWQSLRLGIPTASEFHKIVTPTGKLSSQANGYAHRLIAQIALGRPLVELDNNQWVSRGKELEDEAASAYEFQADVTAKKVGFVTTDDGRIGASPDRLIVDQNGAVEIKCYAPHNHIGCLVEGFGNDHVPQVQGQILVAELDWVDRFAYHPTMPPVLERTYRDEAYIKTLHDALERFCDMKDEMLEKVRARGLSLAAYDGGFPE